MRLLPRFRRKSEIDQVGAALTNGIVQTALAGWEGDNPPERFTSALRFLVGMTYLHNDIKDIERHQALAWRTETVTVPVAKDFRLVIGPAPQGPGPSVADHEDDYWQAERLDPDTGTWVNVTAQAGPWWSKLRGQLAV